jgi:hypothetical protein
LRRSASGYPKVAGIYIAHGPNGVYVGESSDCFDRNDKLIRLGVPWGIVREMADSTSMERCMAEREVADHWAGRGWSVASRNTSAHVQHRRNHGKRHSAHTRALMSDAARGRKFSAEHRANLSLARLGKPRNIGSKRTPETRERMSVAQKGRTFTLETIAKMSASHRARHALNREAKNL